MKGLPAVLFCIVLAAALVACGQDKGKAPTAKRATAQAQKKATKAQKKAPTLAQKKQQDRWGECNKQANLRNMKGEERRRFISSCLGGGA
ncbi:MAG TPA: PsiF family protein [Burkholderiales bacterium]